MAFEQEFDLGLVTAYAYAVSKGYTGTEEEFAELMASYATVAEAAAASAAAAAGSADEAEAARDKSAQWATGSTTGTPGANNNAKYYSEQAAAQAAAAATKASEAASSAADAAGSATTASAKAGEAAASATAAAGSATTASQQATAAAGSATTAGTKANEASESANNAATAKTAAQAAQTAAEAAQTAAETAQGEAEDAAASVSESAAQIATNTEDITELKSATTQLEENVFKYIEKPTFVYHKIINSSGSYQNATEYEACAEEAFIKVKAGDRIEITNGFVYNIGIYSTPATASFIERIAYRSTPYAFSEDKYIRIGIKKPDDSEFVLENAVNSIEIKVIEACYGKNVYEKVFFNYEINPEINSGGRIMYSDGSVETNTAQWKYVIIPLGHGVCTISFKYGYLGSTGGFGFFVNNEWIGYNPTVTPPTAIIDITLPIPNGASEFRTFWNQTDFNTYNKVQKFIVNGTGATTSEHKPVGYQFLYDGNLSFVPEMPTYTESHDLSLLYSLYDGLVTDYPDYIEKIDCSNADPFITVSRPAYLNDMPIYMYHFHPNRMKNTTGGVDNAPRFNVMITCGIHPNEKFNFNTLYRMLEMICENWDSSVDVEQVHGLIDIYVIPCVSPWGYVNGSRVNGNGVNLNRNFPTIDWHVSSTGLDYSGPSAGSEYETQITMYYFREISPMVYIDCHTPSVDATLKDRGTIICSGSDMFVLATIMAQTTSVILTKENPNYPGIDTPLYTVSNNPTFGEANKWAYEQGARSCLLEGSDDNRWVNKAFVPAADKEYQTPTLVRENVQYFFNVLCRMIESASRYFD